MGSVIKGKYKDIELLEKNDAGEETPVAARLYKMGARAAESWLIRALVAALNGGLELPRGVSSKSIEEMGKIVADDNAGFAPKLQSLDAKLVEGLLDELLKYAWFIVPNPDGGNQLIQATPANVDAHLTGFATLFKLKMEVLKFSFGF